MNNANNELLNQGSLILTKMVHRPGAVIKWILILLVYCIPALFLDFLLALLLYAVRGNLLLQLFVIFWTLLYNFITFYILICGSLRLARTVFTEGEHPSFVKMFSLFFKIPHKELRTTIGVYSKGVCIPAVAIAALMIVSSYLFNWNYLHYGFIGLSGMILNVMYSVFGIFTRALSARFAPFFVLAAVFGLTALMVIVLYIVGVGVIRTSAAMQGKKIRSGFRVGAVFLAVIPSVMTFIYLCLAIGLYFLLSSLFYSWLIHLFLAVLETVLLIVCGICFALEWVYGMSMVVSIADAAGEDTKNTRGKRMMMPKTPETAGIPPQRPVQNV